MSAVDDVAAELAEARKNFSAFASAHEGFAILKEEVDELWDEVKGRHPERDARMRAEAIQVGAMAVRFVEDVCDELTGEEVAPDVHTELHDLRVWWQEAARRAAPCASDTSPSHYRTLSDELERLRCQLASLEEVAAEAERMRDESDEENAILREQNLEMNDALVAHERGTSDATRVDADGIQWVKLEPVEPRPGEASRDMGGGSAEAAARPSPWKAGGGGIQPSDLRERAKSWLRRLSYGQSDFDDDSLASLLDDVRHEGWVQGAAFGERRSEAAQPVKEPCHLCPDGTAYRVERWQCDTCHELTSSDDQVEAPIKRRTAEAPFTIDPKGAFVCDHGPFPQQRRERDQTNGNQGRAAERDRGDCTVGADAGGEQPGGDARVVDCPAGGGDAGRAGGEVTPNACKTCPCVCWSCLAEDCDSCGYACKLLHRNTKTGKPATPTPCVTPKEEP